MSQETNTYPVNNVYHGEAYYIKLLTSYAMSRYDWNGLPDTIPQEVIEKMLLTSERNRVIIVEKNGQYFIQPYSGVGVGVYDNYEPQSIYANPILQNGTIDTDFFSDKVSPVLFENYVAFDMSETIKRTAKKLSQYDSSLDIATVNTRNTSVPIANDMASAESLKEFHAKQRAGDYYVLQRRKEDTLIGIDTYQYLPTVPNQYFRTLTELAQLRNNELRLFMNEIGLVMSKDKSEAVLSNESNNDIVLPITRVLSGLKARQDNARKLTEITGYNVTVKLTDAIETMIELYRKEPSVLESDTTDETKQEEEEVVDNE